MSEAPRCRLALLPLDERPVNTLLPVDVARIAGIELDLPPAAALPDLRTSGKVGELQQWLVDRASDPQVSHLIVSIDMLVYGGLIASRTNDASPATCLERLDCLRKIKLQRPELGILAVSTVMRATDQYSATEEPEYWARYGRHIHAFGAAAHRAFLGEAAPPGRGNVPPEVLKDHTRRRLRNHIINISAVELLADGVLSLLAVTADDTGQDSFGSTEEAFVTHWKHLLPGAEELLNYPGADEVCAVLVARAALETQGLTPVVTVLCAEQGGLGRVPKYENQPLSKSIDSQIHAVGATAGPDGDVALVIHAPDPERHDMLIGAPRQPAAAEAAATAALLDDAALRFPRVALADVRYANGTDPLLTAVLTETKLFHRLVAFGAWNTAGNTLGGVLATAIATLTGDLDATAPAVQQARLTRLLDDHTYQSQLREEVKVQQIIGEEPSEVTTAVENAETWLAEHIRSALAELTLPDGDWQLLSARFPWRRLFEVELHLAPHLPAPVPGPSQTVEHYPAPSGH